MLSTTTTNSKDKATSMETEAIRAPMEIVEDKERIILAADTTTTVEVKVVVKVDMETDSRGRIMVSKAVATLTSTPTLNATLDLRRLFPMLRL